MWNKNRRFLTVIKNMGIFLNDQNPGLSPAKKWSFLGLGPMCVATLKGVVREDINRKTFFVFFWALPESPNPPWPYLIFVIFLHGQIFWKIKFTPKNANFSR